MARFLAHISTGPNEERASADFVATIAGWFAPERLIHHGSLTLVMIDGPAITLDRGIIIGALFDRRYPAIVDELRDEDRHKILGGDHAHLIKTFWGDYVAILASPADGSFSIIRAPLGTLPCYRQTVEGGLLLASDVGLLERAIGKRPSPNWDAIARELACAELRQPETCLDTVEMLPPGFRLHIRNTAQSLDALWSPWSFVDHHGDRPVNRWIEEIRRSILNCTTARVSTFDRVALLLSGGLDSSIVAAALGGKRPVDLLTLYTSDRIGDERHYARDMATHIGLPLQEVHRDAGHIDPTQSAARRLPRPAARLFEQETRRITHALAAETGAHSVFTGGGGDNVFCALQSAAPVADRLLRQRIGRGFIDTARDISILAGVGVPRVVRAALIRALPWNRQRPAPLNLSYLSPDVQAIVKAKLTPHPWLLPKKRALPGASAHIKLLAAAQSFADRYDPEEDIPTIAPLLSQPLVEICLAVPSWLWFDQGRNRALVRSAFAGRLPDTILRRRSKGTPESFVGEIFEAHHPTIRDMLLDGRLIREGLIDRKAVEAALRGGPRMVPPDVLSLLRLIDVEGWLQARAP